MAKLIHTMIRVHDLERSLRVYRDAFNLEVSHRLDFPDFTLAYLRNAQADTEIELTWNRGRTERYSHGDGYGHVAFCVDDAHSVLKGTGIITGTLAFSSIFAALAPSRVWAVELQGLDSHQGEVILAFTRQVYPHPTLDDAVYALVKDLDGKARKDPAVQQQLAAGVQQLDALGGSNWAKRDARGRAKEVVYYNSNGKLQRQKARIVAVAGNSIETPRLLLNSHSGRFADGLANSSGQVG